MILQYNEKLAIDVRENDGVYAVVKCPSPSDRLARHEIYGAIELYGITGIDTAAVNELLNAPGPRAEKRISAQASVYQAPETVSVKTDEEGSAAYLVFKQAVNGGATLSEADIRAEIAGAGIVFGLMDKEIRDVARNRLPNIKYLIAEGKKPVNGTDGHLVYHFDTGRKTFAPKELPDGRVDFKEMNRFDTVFEGQTLITTVDAAPGQDGMNVFGTVMAYRPGKPAKPLPRGKNTRTDADEKTLYAAVGGLLIASGSKLDVSPVLEIPGNVDTAVGDVSFNGTVIIRGGVLTGYTVTATGNIEVFGIVEGARLHSDADIILHGGVHGQDKAVICARGDIFAGHAANCVFETNRNMFADSLLQCDVNCMGNLRLAGKRGLLVGGKVMVGGDVELKSVGSPIVPYTEIHIGNDPKKVEEFRKIMAELNSYRKEYDEMSKTVDTLTALGNQAPLPDEKKSALLRALHGKIALRQNLVSLQEQIAAITPLLEHRRGRLIVKDLIRAGAKVVIGDASTYIREDSRHCRIRNVDSKIVIEPLL